LRRLVVVPNSSVESTPGSTPDADSGENAVDTRRSP